jgi:RimJ/RimL family protein N-acetyltransferase
MSTGVDSGRISFARFAERDAPLMHHWLRRPHVAAWWHDPPSLEEIVSEYVTGPTVDPYIVHFDGRPIGFIQSYVAATTGDGWWPEITDPGVVGIDQFIGEASLVGQGIGTAMVRAFVARLFDDSRVTMVQVDPHPDNARAIRCYEKAGFRAERVIDTPDGPALYMTVARAGAGTSAPDDAD